MSAETYRPEPLTKTGQDLVVGDHVLVDATWEKVEYISGRLGQDRMFTAHFAGGKRSHQMYLRTVVIVGFER